MTVTGHAPDARYVALGRLSHALCREGRKRGLTGDPLTEIGQMGTLDDELLAIELVLALPTDIRDSAPTLAKRMARALVQSHRRAP
jgi:hypothetical protein